MSTTYECQTCNVISDRAEELCKPVTVDIRCDYGRSLEERTQAMCKPTRALVRDACDMCGRPTLNDHLVCMPTRFKD